MLSDTHYVKTKILTLEGYYDDLNFSYTHNGDLCAFR